MLEDPAFIIFKHLFHYILYIWQWSLLFGIKERSEWASTGSPWDTRGRQLAHLEPPPLSLLKVLSLLSLCNVNYLHFKIFCSEGELYCLAYLEGTKLISFTCTRHKVLWLLVGSSIKYLCHVTPLSHLPFKLGRLGRKFLETHQWRLSLTGTHRLWWRERDPAWT